MLMEQIEVIEVKGGPDLEAIHLIRKLVFVDEQQVPADLEFEHEEESRHYLAKIDGLPVGTARWRVVDGKKVKLERFAVLKNFRGKGVGNTLLQTVLKDAMLSGVPVMLHAQVSALNFYRKNGFDIEGEAFDEAGIEHYRMTYRHTTL